MTWLKICGTTNREDALAAVNAGADAVGFVFAPSPRRISPQEAAVIAPVLPRSVDKVGVFANESAETIGEIAQQVGLNIIQLQGDETPEFARTLLRDAGGQPSGRARVRIFKAVSVVPGVESQLRAFAASGVVDAVLLDSLVVRTSPDGHRETLRGGTGVAFDWRRAADFVPGIAQRTRVILAGGLSPANVVEAVRTLRPWGVDVCSGVEQAPGRKDHDKVWAFISAVRAID